MAVHFLPLFPLNLVVYPNEKLKLHVFEPRYQQLVSECQKQQSTFGIPTYIEGKVKEFGTEMRLVNIEHIHPNGEMDIVTRGIRVFRLTSFEKQATGKLYPGGNVEFQPNVEDNDSLLHLEIQEQLKLLYNALNVKPKIRPDFNSFEIAHNIGFSIEQEYELFQISKESERQSKILAHLKEIVPVVVQTEQIKAKVQMNGHFKNLNILDL